MLQVYTRSPANSYRGTTGGAYKIVVSGPTLMVSAYCAGEARVFMCGKRRVRLLALGEITL